MEVFDFLSIFRPSILQEEKKNKKYDTFFFIRFVFTETASFFIETGGLHPQETMADRVDLSVYKQDQDQ